MKAEQLLHIYKENPKTQEIAEELKSNSAARIYLKGLKTSAKSILAASIHDLNPLSSLIICPDKEAAAYFYNDLENLKNEQGLPVNKKSIHFYPAGYKKVFSETNADNNNILLRAEILNAVLLQNKKSIIVSYPEALAEKVVTKNYLQENTLVVHKNQDYSIDFITELLVEYKYVISDFVYEPGQYAIRGGIVDIYAYTDEKPFRIEFFGDTVESIRTFDPVSQLSVEQFDKVAIFPNFQEEIQETAKQSFLEYIPTDFIIWSEAIKDTAQVLKHEKKEALKVFKALPEDEKNKNPEDLLIGADEFLEKIENFRNVEFGTKKYFNTELVFTYSISAQPSFNKNFNILIDHLNKNTKDKIHNLILSGSNKQLERIYSVIEDIHKENTAVKMPQIDSLKISLHEGFVDKELNIACYTDHQIFERYHRFRLRDGYQNKQAITLKEFADLKPGDFVTHIDHGVGKFAGLEKIDVNGKPQEAIRLVYKEHDILYVSIHSLHKISKFSGKDGTEPKLHRLGGNAWANLKKKTKSKVKDIARDLINLYAKRKAQKGFAFMEDTYLQHELEASFFYEDTPDQVKATASIKEDMQRDFPMDRLVCGDVGFGKTEVAMRAAFKAVSDSKQVAVLVPTTILALQHYKTFKERFKDMPCTVDYINRFKSAKQQKDTLSRLKEGQVDVIIGTHRLTSKDVEFKDLGLLIIDEEQKFGVAVKDKLKKLKVNVDTLTLTATPIPRTLQFSLMGARDLSIINTPPPNRYPIQTELHIFNEELVRKAIMDEFGRGGQVFFVHNRVQNIKEIAAIIQKICPEVTIAIGHGQMEGKELEKVMYNFIEGEYDVLLATTIIEAGLDIPNANTIIINDAHNYGLSDLHQLRGRVGRTNKKAFCYLLSKPTTTLTQDARRRLKAIEEFSELGSGFNISMRDLDIRGAGNMLGGEQSGFISDIGFETYHKILDEAIQELKETDFKELFKEELKKKPIISDCQIETDFELLMPEDYVNEIRERLSLYKELDNIETEAELENFRAKLRDRFGPLPKQTEELINTIRLRWVAREIGFERLILKNGKFMGYFISDPQSSYFQSESFAGVLEYVKQFPANCQLKEKNDKLRLLINNVGSINAILLKLTKMLPQIAGE